MFPAIVGLLLVAPCVDQNRHEVNNCFSGFGVTHCWEYIAKDDYVPLGYIPAGASDFSVFRLNENKPWGEYPTEKHGQD